MPWRSRYSSSDSSTRSATQSSASSRSAAEIADPEVVAQRGIDLLGRVDVAVRHPSPECLGSHVDELDLLRGAHHRVGHRFALHDAGDPLDDVVERFEVLDVDRRDDVDAGREQLVDVLPALGVAGAGHVRVRQLVDERDLGARASNASRSISSKFWPRYSMTLRETTSRSRSCAPVSARPWVSTNPTTTSVPRSLRRHPSLSMAKVLPTPGAAPT